MTDRRSSLLVLLAGVSLTAACAPLAVRGGPASLRVMTYNIQAGGGNLSGIVDVIRASMADVVALQEVDVHWSDRSAFADQATELGAQLGMNVRFARIYQLPAANERRESREFGVALLSKYSVSHFRNDSLTRLSTQDTSPAPTPMPGLLEATLDVNGQQVRVFNTHLDYRADPRVRVQQVAEMIHFIGESSSPTIVFGDLNATPDAPEVAPLLRLLHDGWSGQTDPGLTYPANIPAKRIDYVLVSSHFGIRNISVIATQASDHRPVVADLLLGRQRNATGGTVARRVATAP